MREAVTRLALLLVIAPLLLPVGERGNVSAQPAASGANAWSRSGGGLG
jgi:hypothetical protein